MVHQRRGLGHVVVKGNQLLQYSSVSGLPHIGAGARDEPQGIVVKAAADIGVAFFGQGLILMISAAMPLGN